MKPIWIMMAVLAAWAPCARAGDKVPINNRVPEFNLSDQFDRVVPLRSYEGRVLVLLASDKEGSSQKEPWKRALIERYKRTIALVGVADVHTVPFFLKGTIKSSFKNEGGCVLMDWKAQLFRALGLRKDATNVVVVDKHGVLRYMISGQGSDQSFQKLFAEIDRLQ